MILVSVKRSNFRVSESINVEILASWGSYKGIPIPEEVSESAIACLANWTCVYARHTSKDPQVLTKGIQVITFQVMMLLFNNS